MPRKTRSKDRSPAKPAKVRSPYGRADLNKFKALLVARRRKLVGDVDRLENEALQKANSGDLSSLPMHMADQGTDNFEQDLTLGLMQSEGEELKEIESALARLKDGSFGICENCRKPIPKARLQAIPYARLCLSCKRREEGE